MVMDRIIPLLIALVLIAIAWKVFAGIVKTIVLLVILGAAALFVFGGFG